MHTPVVELKKLQVMLVGGAGEVNSLKGLDLTVTAGQSVSVVGPSGSGKTTLLMVIAGLERPTSGTVTVTGRDLGRMNEDDLARFRRQHVGIVFQSFHLIPTMTALENAALPLEFAGVAGARDRAAQALKSVGLGNRLAHYPSQLSGGEQQRVALARAVVNRPSLL
ncbi:MAG: ABC transporter ATP-binding protein, partial [Desulfohalobiaceae bacterium]